MIFFSDGSEMDKSAAKPDLSDEEWAEQVLSKKTNVRNFRSDAE